MSGENPRRKLVIPAKLAPTATREADPSPAISLRRKTGRSPVDGTSLRSPENRVVRTQELQQRCEAISRTPCTLPSAPFFGGYFFRVLLWRWGFRIGLGGAHHGASTISRFLVIGTCEEHVFGWRVLITCSKKKFLFYLFFFIFFTFDGVVFHLLNVKYSISKLIRSIESIMILESLVTK